MDGQSDTLHAARGFGRTLSKLLGTRSPHLKVASTAALVALLALVLVPLPTLADTTGNITVTAGIPFTAPTVQFQTIGGLPVAVTFNATSSISGTVVVTAGSTGRSAFFGISAPPGGTITVSTATVDGFSRATLALIRVLDASVSLPFMGVGPPVSAVIASCDTTTVSFALGTEATLCIPPACQAPGASLVVVPETDGFAPFPRDNRYFPETGYRIDNDTIFDYFSRRGGVDTFGYPVSRTFLLEGFTVQIFQRRVVQLDRQGQARLLNLLDPGLMPYTSFNGATFPGADIALLASAPDPTDSEAMLSFVKAHAPDSFNGLPVGFYQSFLNTVSFSTAFPGGAGDPNLLPGFDLEMWGIPTSDPVLDPNDSSFAYLRWQRGIMHYRTDCNCTEGILLGDYFKSIITGVNLPADLASEAKNSPFYKQYDPTAFLSEGLSTPSLLPNTNLLGAFQPFPFPFNP
ncbi:MAG: hypothetical protein Q8R28_06390 [Dehalococcoidia bacterium]|nr:hypothetical protein [Dehalococcoidia bacterium]